MVENSIQEKRATMGQPDQGAGFFFHVEVPMRIDDVPLDDAYDNTSRSVFSHFKTPKELMSFGEEVRDRQYIKSGFGLNSIWIEKRAAPSSQNFCQIAKRENS